MDKNKVTTIEKDINGKKYLYTVRAGQLGHGLSVSLQIDGRPASGFELSDNDIEALKKHLA